jgi:membrane protein
MPIGSFIKRQIATSLPGKTIIGQSKKVFLPGFHGLSVYEIWRPFIEQLRKTSLTERAGGISFNIVMAIPPTLIFLFTLIPYLPISKQFIGELFSIIRDTIPGEKDNAVIIHFLNSERFSEQSEKWPAFLWSFINDLFFKQRHDGHIARI